ncbi:MAG: hypothetical protein BWK76_23760 [Desulfobulbaceae bacterium A2]|nr:MAG: hypothetical protein BWK76_23760 [Desulfobulbaceae bacterium A2]
MKPLWQGLLIAVVHLALVSSLGAKLLHDRASRPRVWTQTVPFDPNLPLRGRYVRLQLVVEPRGITDDPEQKNQPYHPVIVLAEEGRLVATALPDTRHGAVAADQRLRFIQRQDTRLAVLNAPVAFFISEHVPDPSRTKVGEELWAEVTIPAKGPPRPIRLGLKKGDGPIVPLSLR